MYIGHLDEATTREDIIDYMAERNFNMVKECTALRTRGRNKAFKIAIPAAEKGTVDNENFWPKGVTFRPYEF
ncbi:hypothetical protein ANN_03925 [Periplaneta americana]|uniref:RRM domain-containing protein n=1 Tax=Periplaneta americana TaxID=6978 RepID=A0ABQ8T8L8_PERAM|nr:hypothetical protein ANN_03925 [Periplaneta americana]